jgi:hypothetical protein
MIRQILILSLLFLSACGGKEVDFGTFDLKKFKNDRGGCKGDRANMIEDFKEIKPKILGLSERTSGGMIFKCLTVEMKRFLFITLIKASIANTCKTNQLRSRWLCISILLA